MRTSRLPRLTAADAEHLLDGGGDPSPLAALLSAAAGPGEPEELAGEAAALAAFASADHSLPSIPLETTPVSRMILSKILAAKALAVLAVAAGATGGVALAASTTAHESDHRPAATTSNVPPRLDDDALSGTDAAEDAGTTDDHGGVRGGSAGHGAPAGGQAADDPSGHDATEDAQHASGSCGVGHDDPVQRPAVAAVTACPTPSAKPTAVPGGQGRADGDQGEDRGNGHGSPVATPTAVSLPVPANGGHGKD